MNRKTLNEKKNDLLNEIDDLISKAKAEKRQFTAEENNIIKRSMTEVEAINLELGKDVSTTSENAESRLFDGVLYPHEKLEKRYYSQDKGLDLGKLVRGISGQGWHGAEEEREYYRAMESGSNKVVIPQRLADRILDYARSSSAMFGKIPVVEMENNNLTIAVQTKDGQAHFVKEGDLIPTTDIAFEPVKLEGKTLALFVPISEQLLETASNLSEQLVYSCAKAIGQALDVAMLYGEGVGEEGEGAEILGVTNYDTVNKVTHNKADYDLVIKGAKAVKKANLVPTNVCFNTDLASDLEMLKTADGQYIERPSSLDVYDIAESNNVKSNEAIVYDREALLMGLQKGITIEWGTVGDMFQRIQKGLRIHLRADLGVIRPQGVSIVNIE